MDKQAEKTHLQMFDKWHGGLQLYLDLQKAVLHLARLHLLVFPQTLQTHTQVMLVFLLKPLLQQQRHYHR